jgi:8-oxo-dGTP pyrophosphatase MutT (NUDIX family)
MEQQPILSAGVAGGRELTPADILARFAAAPAPGRRGSPAGPAGDPRQAPQASVLSPQASVPAPQASLQAGARVRGDHDLNPDLRPQGALRAAAVLVPLVMRPAGITVLLTQRTDHLHAHAGQISFPGGMLDPEDRGAEDAALRETEEEVGIARDFVELVGRLDTYVTRTGFEVTPLVGLVRPDFTLAPDTFEVAEVFEVPLGFLIDPANHRRESRVLGGSTRYFYAMPWNRYYIWGATAGMLVNLSEVLWPHVPGQQPPVGQTARP